MQLQLLDEGLHVADRHGLRHLLCSDAGQLLQLVLHRKLEDGVEQLGRRLRLGVPQPALPARFLYM